MNRNGFKILLHLVSWLFFVCLIAAFLQNGNMNNKNLSETILSGSFLFFTGFYALVFYINYYVLMPRLFLQKHYLLFGFIAFSIFAITFYIKPFEHIMHASRNNIPQTTEPPPNFQNRQMELPQGDRPPPDMKPMPARDRQRIDIISLIFYFMAMAVSAMLVLSRQWRITEKNRALAEAQKANAELAFLKAQISPHFLFNILNNIYALVITKNDKAASGVLRLSNIMRYVTDDARDNFVPIEKEIACINDFIALQQLRLSNNVLLNYTITGMYGNVTVAPLILMSFIENTFKHGVSNNIPSEIRIDINVNDFSTSLTTHNTIVKKNKQEAREGIGLQNVMQRLELLYPQKYKLQSQTIDNTYKVLLVLQNEKN